MKTALWVALLVGALALLLPAPGHSQTHTRVTVLARGCAERLDSLIESYSSPAANGTADCDQECLQACAVTLEAAIESIHVEKCPLQNDITRCLKIQGNAWVDYATKCALFSFDTAALTAEGEGRRRRLQHHQDVVEELLAQKEAAAASEEENLYDGCFPAFESVDDFETYVQGRWWETHGKPSNTVGIILSVVFWISLAGVGYLL